MTYSALAPMFTKSRNIRRPTAGLGDRKRKICGARRWIVNTANVYIPGKVTTEMALLAEAFSISGVVVVVSAGQADSENQRLQQRGDQAQDQTDLDAHLDGDIRADLVLASIDADGEQEARRR